MRILMVSFLLPHARTQSGAGVVMQGQLAALRGRHEVTLVIFAVTDAAEWAALKQLRESGVRVHVLGEAVPSSVIRCKRRLERLLGRLRGWPSLGNPNYIDPRLPRLLDRLIEQESFDLLQVENIGLGNFPYKARISSLLVEHEVLAPRSRDKRDGRRWQPSVWRQFDRIQVFTARDAASIGDAAPDVAERVRINPFGMALPRMAGVDREEPGTVVFIGGFNHPPNVDAALWAGTEIMPLLRILWPGVRFLIVGADPPASVKALESDDVAVTGRVPAVEPYLEQAAVVLAPMRSGGGMRVKVLQAMAMARPVVTTPLGAEGLAGDRSQQPVAIAETAEGIANATAGLLASRDARAALGRRARAFVSEHHSWSAYLRRLEAIYAELQSPTCATTARSLQ